MNHNDTTLRSAPQSGSDAIDRVAIDPFVTTTSSPAIGQPAPPIQRRGLHRWWIHLLMCVPMVAVVAYLIVTGAAGLGAIGYAVLCMVMMGAMMLLMNHGSHGDHKH